MVAFTLGGGRLKIQLCLIGKNEVMADRSS